MASVFFFQAEDGIRDLTVTGVQTCALPISAVHRRRLARRAAPGGTRHVVADVRLPSAWAPAGRRAFLTPATLAPAPLSSRPAPTRTSQGTSEPPGRGAVPPNPVAGAPDGATWLPAASTRSSSLMSPGSSSTTMVWIVPAASVIALLVRSDRPVALTTQLPGETVL